MWYDRPSSMTVKLLTEYENQVVWIQIISDAVLNLILV